MNFPVSLDELIAHQEHLIHRELTADQREAIAVWLPIINDVYEHGLDDGDLEMMGTYISRAVNHTVAHFLKAARAWMVFADESRTAAKA